MLGILHEFSEQNLEIGVIISTIHYTKVTCPHLLRQVCRRLFFVLFCRIVLNPDLYDSKAIVLPIMQRNQNSNNYEKGTKTMILNKNAFENYYYLTIIHAHKKVD